MSRSPAMGEARAKVKEGPRVTAKVSGDAHDALVLLSSHYGLAQNTVMDCLLLAAGRRLLYGPNCSIAAVMQQQGMSRAEAVFFLEASEASLSDSFSEGFKGHMHG